MSARAVVRVAAISVGIFVGISCVVPRGAGAETTFAVLPGLALGATDNVFGVSSGREWDVFTVAGATAKVRYQGARTNHGIGYKLSYTHFFTQDGADTLSNELAYLSSFSLTAALTLNLAANATLSRTSSVGLGDVATTVPQAVFGGAQLYLSTSASEELIYQPTPRWRFREDVRVGQLNYLGDAAGFPTSRFISGTLGSAFLHGRDTFSLDAKLTDSYTSGNTLDPFYNGHVFLAQALAGWSRELSLRWAAGVQGGVLGVFKWGGDIIWNPAGSISAQYRRLPWFFTMGASHAPAANLYVGQATVNDQVVLRGTLPLSKSELVYMSVFGSYTYARLVTPTNQLTSAYDQWLGGVSVAGTLARYPLWWAAEYTLVHQDERSASSGAHNLTRQAVLLSIGGTFTWGPGTPPLMHGTL